MLDVNRKKIKESITNIRNFGVIPAEEAQLSLDVLYESILDKICSVVPMESPRQVISCLKLVYGSENKSLVETSDDNIKDAYKLMLMNGVGAMPFNDDGYASDIVRCNIILDSNDTFVSPYGSIVGGTISINDDEIVDKGDGILYKSGAQVGTVDYELGIIKINEIKLKDSSVLNYKTDLINLMSNRNFAQFQKSFIEIFADIYQLDIDSALVLNDFKGLNLKDNINNIMPQVLAQQIDQYILDRYFKQAEQNLIKAILSDTQNLNQVISKSTGDFVKRTGVMPNILICDPESYGVLSADLKFIPVNMIDKDSANNYAGTPRLVGYYNNFTVFLVTQHPISDVNIVLTYKGTSDAQSAGVYAPYIPVTLRTVNGMESQGMITTTNAYSIAGFAMINPDLVMGIQLLV